MIESNLKHVIIARRIAVELLTKKLQTLYDETTDDDCEPIPFIDDEKILLKKDPIDIQLQKVKTRSVKGSTFLHFFFLFLF